MKYLSITLGIALVCAATAALAQTPAPPPPAAAPAPPAQFEVCGGCHETTPGAVSLGAWSGARRAAPTMTIRQP